MNPTTSQLIDQTADVLEERGWRNDGGGWHPDMLPADAPLCVEGALWVWNDNVPQTADEVIADLLAAALIEAAKENAETREAVTSA